MHDSHIASGHSIDDSKRLRCPDFIVIGAMKSSSTTLYHDLLLNPNIYLPDKETGCLHASDAGVRFHELYKGASDGLLCGEFSTTYAMLPDATEVVPRAKKILPLTTKIVYLVREPISRTISHHKHMSRWHGDDRMSDDINQELLRRPELINYSRYAMQLKPWIEVFGKKNIHVIEFSNYTRNRRQVVDELCQFLGVESKVGDIHNDVIHNQSVGKPITSSFWQKVIHHPVYREWIRPWTNQRARDRFRECFFQKAAPVTGEITRGSVDKMIATFTPDILELQSMLEHDQPLWTLATSYQNDQPDNV